MRSRRRHEIPQPTLDLPAAVARRIGQIALPEAISDPYTPKAKSQSTTHPIGASISTSSDGRMMFGSAYGVRRLYLPGYELTYAHQRVNPELSSFVITAFEDNGGFASRTTFTSRDQGIRKQYDTAPQNHFGQSPTFSRIIAPREVEVLAWALTDPNVEEIQLLATPNAMELGLLKEYQQVTIGQNEQLAQQARIGAETERQQRINWFDEDQDIIGTTNQ